MFLKRFKNQLKLKKIKKALSYHNSFKFFKGQGTDVLSNFKEGEIIFELLKQGLNKQAYGKLESFAFALSMEIGGRYFGEREHFAVPKVYEQFRDFMFHDEHEITVAIMCIEGERKIQLKRERLEILKKLLEEKRLDTFRDNDQYIEWYIQVMREGNSE